MARDSSASAYTVSSGSEEEAYAPESSASPPKKRPKPSPKTARQSNGTGAKSKAVANGKGKSKAGDPIVDIEDGPSIDRLHGPEYHDVAAVVAIQTGLLDWFESVREKRGMPWRKKYDPTMTMEEKGQRAYEIWVSEVMLQQTQVSTVIAYWNRWIEKWPTIADLAKADVEEVNAMWRGLGYYRRARSLLEGAKTVMSKAKYHGRLPSDTTELEKEIPGVGRYTAGAICSTAYGVRASLVDGNVHRLLTRLLAIHAPQTAPTTIKLLWKAATELVEALPEDRGEGIAGDWNQALMELGSQVCKPVAPECKACPLRPSCKAYAELAASPPEPSDTPCSICEPVPSSSSKLPAVTVFPMRKEKKVSREEEEVVCVVEWGSGEERRWLFTKRPDKGLLAGLFQPPTTPVTSESTSEDRETIASQSIYTHLHAAQLAVSSVRSVTSVPHVFSHINMVYHVVHLILSPDATEPPEAKSPAVWLDAAGVESANVGTGVKKVWASIYGSWGSFEVGKAAPKTKVTEKKRKSEVIAPGGMITKWFVPSSAKK